MEPLYEDPWIRCDSTTLEIRGYYFPLATPKVIAYRDIQAVAPIPLGLWTGRWCIWGTSHPGYWWHLDWSRPRKTSALVLDVGRPVRPVITPSDPGGFLAVPSARNVLDRARTWVTGGVETSQSGVATHRVGGLALGRVGNIGAHSCIAALFSERLDLERCDHQRYFAPVALFALSPLDPIDMA